MGAILLSHRIFIPLRLWLHGLSPVTQQQSACGKGPRLCGDVCFDKHPRAHWDSGLPKHPDWHLFGEWDMSLSCSSSLLLETRACSCRQEDLVHLHVIFWVGAGHTPREVGNIFESGVSRKFYLKMTINRKQRPIGKPGIYLEWHAVKVKESAFSSPQQCCSVALLLAVTHNLRSTWQTRSKQGKRNLREQGRQVAVELCSLIN